jgi:heme exporter protein A
MLQASGLGCERNERQLFADLSLSLAPGEILQISGNNGSGKTTLLKILMGLFSDYVGNIDWSLDRPPLYLGHRPGLSDRLTVAENLHWLCTLQDTDPGEAAMDSALALLGLAGYQDIACGSLSEGQRKRVNLCRFLLCDSPCWVMDEPFSAIDQSGLGFVEARMQAQLDAGGAILLTSHQTLNMKTEVRRLELVS